MAEKNESKVPTSQRWMPIPKGKKGGFRRRTRGGWEYKYPDKGKAVQGSLFAPKDELHGHVPAEVEYGEAPTLDEAVRLQREQNVPIVMSYGMGVDSTAILVGMHRRGIRPDAILFADTGAEKAITYAYLPIINEWLEKVGFPQVTVVKRAPYSPKESTVSQATGTPIGGKLISTLPEECEVKETVPSLAMGGRRCSQTWKHDAMDKLVRNWEPAAQALAHGFKPTRVIGYDAGPVDIKRGQGPEDIETDKWSYVYPLREWGKDREDAKEMIRDAGLLVPEKSACWFCPSTKPFELKEMARTEPDLLRRIIQIEARAEPGFRKILGLWRTPTKGHRGAEKKPGSMSEYIVGEELLPEFEGVGRTLAPPWWQAEGPVKDPPQGFKAADVVDRVREPAPDSAKDLESYTGPIGEGENFVPMSALQNRIAEKRGAALTKSMVNIYGGEELRKAWSIKRKVSFQGYPVSIENEPGDVRKWKDEHSGMSGQTVMKLPYGYIRGTEGADASSISGENGYSRTQQDHVDVYLGPNEKSEYVYVVHQKRPPEWIHYDEDKVFLGFDGETAVWEAYGAHHSAADKAWGGVSTYTHDEFRAMLGERKGMPLVKSENEYAMVLAPHGYEDGLFWVEPLGGVEFLSKAGQYKYIKREPTGDPKRPWRYYYAEESAAREVKSGHRVMVGHETVDVLDVAEDGTIEATVGEEKRTFAPGEWSEFLATHYGDQFLRWAEKKAAEGAKAVKAKVSKTKLLKLGAGGSIPDGSAITAVLLAFESELKRAGVSEDDASYALFALHQSIHEAKEDRTVWTEDAKATAIAALTGKMGKPVSSGVGMLADAASNLAGPHRDVEAKHVAGALALEGLMRPDKEYLGGVDKASDKEIATLEKASKTAHENPTPENRKAAVQAAANTPATDQLNLFGQAFPGAQHEKPVKKARKAKLKAPAAAPAPKAPPKTEGSLGVFFVAGEGGKPVAMASQYKLMEAGDIIASHKPGSFEKHPDYPEDVQERAYHRDTSEQDKVRRNAQRMHPEFVVNTNPDAVNGPPILTKDNIVLGGNSRTMSMQTMYADHPEKAAEMKSYLAEHAYEVGLTAEDVNAMKNPVLVRVVTPPSTDKKDLQVMVRQMNESFTQAMDPRTMQVAMGRRLTDDSLKALADTMEEGETLSSFLSTSRAQSFIDNLRKNGVIDQRNENQYMLTGTNKLNPDGKTLVERILVGRIVESGDVLSNTRASTLASIARAVPYMVQAEAYGEGYKIRETLRLAMDGYSQMVQKSEEGLMRLPSTELKHKNKKIGQEKAEDTYKDNIAQMQAVLPIDGQKAHPVFENEQAMAMMKFLAFHSDRPKVVADTFKNYAAQAAANPEGQGGMFGPPKTPAQVFEDSIKLATDAEAKAQAEKEKPAEKPAPKDTAQGGMFGKSEFELRKSMLERFGLEEGGPEDRMLKSMLEEYGLEKSDQLAMFARPPGSGWEPIPGGKKNGFRRRKGTGFEYWYPGGEAKAVKKKKTAKPKVTIEKFRGDREEKSARILVDGVEVGSMTKTYTEDFVTASSREVKWSLRYVEVHLYGDENTMDVEREWDASAATGKAVLKEARDFVKEHAPNHLEAGKGLVEQRTSRPGTPEWYTRTVRDLLRETGEVSPEQLDAAVERLLPAMMRDAPLDDAAGEFLREHAPGLVRVSRYRNKVKFSDLGRYIRRTVADLKEGKAPGAPPRKPDPVPKHVDLQRRVEAFMRGRVGAPDIEDHGDSVLVRYQTREHGDMLTDTAGEEDIRGMMAVAEKLRQEFGDAVEVRVDTVDEWTDVSVRIPKDQMVKSEAGFKFLRKEPTGNPQRPWRYVYHETEKTSGRFRDRKRRLKHIPAERFVGHIKDAVKQGGDQYNLAQPLKTALDAYKTLVTTKALDTDHPVSQDPKARIIMDALLQGSGNQLERILRRMAQYAKEEPANQPTLTGQKITVEDQLRRAAHETLDAPAEHLEVKREGVKVKKIVEEEASRQGSLF